MPPLLPMTILTIQYKGIAHLVGVRDPSSTTAEAGSSSTSAALVSSSNATTLHPRSTSNTAASTTYTYSPLYSIFEYSGIE